MWFTGMNRLDELTIDSWNYVEGLESPIGIYLRREIFRKENRRDTNLKRELYERLTGEQSEDGSWSQLFVHTANNLWDLALLGCEAKDKSVKKALDWLLSTQKYEYRGYPGFFNTSNRKDPSLMRSTFYGEFGPGCWIFYQTTYAVHLFHIFGLDEYEQVQTTVKSYLQF